MNQSTKDTKSSEGSKGSIHWLDAEEAVRVTACQAKTVDHLVRESDGATERMSLYSLRKRRIIFVYFRLRTAGIRSGHHQPNGLHPLRLACFCLPSEASRD
jgi:hypothetical protein